jgi:hypothetical protein
LFSGNLCGNTLEPLCNEQPDNALFLAELSLANAVLGEKEAALKEAECAIMLCSKDRMWGSALEENLAVIQMMVLPWPDFVKVRRTLRVAGACEFKYLVAWSE